MVGLFPERFSSAYITVWIIPASMVKRKYATHLYNTFLINGEQMYVSFWLFAGDMK